MFNVNISSISAISWHVVDDKDRLKWYIRVHVLGPKYVDSEIV